MTSPDLPAELKAALDGKLRGFSRNDAAGRAATISKTYRDGGGSGAIRSEADALAYALARMPATYAAVTASLNALNEIRPDFAPNSLLDIGAGPGTATWAAAEAFPSLRNFTLLDANDALRTLAVARHRPYRIGLKPTLLPDHAREEFQREARGLGRRLDHQAHRLARLAFGSYRGRLLDGRRGPLGA